jgi:hypothetical protein
MEVSVKSHAVLLTLLWVETREGLEGKMKHTNFYPYLETVGSKCGS